MRALALLALVAAAGCVRLQWSRTSAEQPIAEETAAQLAPGDDLGRCLELLGAPTGVWKAADGGIALAYTWTDRRRFGISVSVPLDFLVSPSFSYDGGRRRAEGVVVLLDRDAKVRFVRYGLLTAADLRG